MTTALSAAVFEHLRRSLATEGNKIIVNEFGELKISADVLDIIQSLNSSHPIIKLLEEHVKYLYTRSHISSPLAVLLLLSLVERAVALTAQYNLAPHHFAQHWQQLLECTRDYIARTAVVPDAAQLARHSAHALSTALALPRATLAHLSRTALHLIGRHWQVLEATGPRVSAAVLPHVTVRSDTCPITCSDLRVLCVSVALEHVVAPLLEALVDLAPDLLLCRALDPTLHTHLAQCGITALVVTAEQMVYLAARSGGTIHSSIEHVLHCTEQQLGRVARIETETDECLRQHLVSFTEFAANDRAPVPRAELVHEPTTVLIRAPHPALAQQCRRALLDTVAQLTRVSASTVLLLSDDTCHALAQLAPTENELVREVWTRAWLDLPLPRDTVLASHVLLDAIESALHTALKLLRVDQVLAM